MLQWREIKTAKIKIANLLAKTNVSRVYKRMIYYQAGDSHVREIQIPSVLKES